MTNLENFYHSILNLRQKDCYEKIKEITLTERKKVLAHTSDLTGYCKYLASQIYDLLQEENINTYWLDLTDIININHTILIAEYKHNSELKRILIDPTYSQFTKKTDQRLIKLEHWPSERLHKHTLNNLLQNGIIELDDNIFKDYLNSFTTINDDISLDKFLLDQKLGKRIKH